MEAEIKLLINRKQFGLLLFCISSLSIMIFWSLGYTGMGPIDDHRFILTLFQGKDFGAYIMPEVGRYIPFTAQEYVFASNILNPSPELFHAINAFKLAVVGFLLFISLKSTNANNVTVLILWSVVIFSIGFANASSRLQIGEINALLLTIIFIWSVLKLEKKSYGFSYKHNIIAIGGLVAFSGAFFYKELIFVLAVSFFMSEFLRFWRYSDVASIPLRYWVLFLLGLAYISFYAVWRFNASGTSYADFSSIDTWQVIQHYSANDPFIIFVLLPIFVFRLIIVSCNLAKQTIYDSFIVAAVTYLAAYIVLGMYNVYYLLPAYGFAVCGVSGVLAAKRDRLYVIVLISAFAATVNTFPIAVSDMLAIRSIANNHYYFVKNLSRWLLQNESPDSKPRNLVLAGVSSGSGIEVLISLKIYLEYFGVPESKINIVAAELSDNKAISSHYGVVEEAKHEKKLNDVLIFNPYQKSHLHPPLLSPSYSQILTTEEKWVIPRWHAWTWVKTCRTSVSGCVSSAKAGARYTGYEASLVTRTSTYMEPIPLVSPKYRLGPLNMPSRLKKNHTMNYNILIENTGSEVWPAIGALVPGKFVNLAYIWLDESGNVVLEGARSPFLESILPNDVAILPLIIKTPGRPGQYRLMISPVQEGVRWFYVGYDEGKVIEVY